MTRPGAPGTAADHYKVSAPHACQPGPYEFGRRPCDCHQPIPAPTARQTEGAKA